MSDTIDSAAYKPRITVRKAIDFNPEWLDERGFMTNVPGPNYFRSLNLPEGVNEAVGFYIAKRDHNGRRPDDEDVYQFKIRPNRIIQQVSTSTEVRIEFSQITKVGMSTRSVIERWEHCLVDVDGSAPRPEWRKTEVASIVTLPHGPNACPSTMRAFLYCLSHQLAKTWSSLGLKKHSKNDDKWLFELAAATWTYSHRDSDNSVHPKDMWMYGAVPASGRALWFNAVTWVKHLEHLDYEMFEPGTVSLHIQTYRDFQRQAMELKEAVSKDFEARYQEVVPIAQFVS